MNTQWEYRTLVPTWYYTRDSSKKNPQLDWIVQFADGSQWDGWPEILGNLGDQGWEVFSVIVQEETGHGGVEHIKASQFRVFAKRPR